MDPSMNADMKKRLVEARRAIQQKYRILLNEEIEADEVKQKLFKPILDPLNEMVQSNKSSLDKRRRDHDMLKRSIVRKQPPSPSISKTTTSFAPSNEPSTSYQPPETVKETPSREPEELKKRILSRKEAALKYLEEVPEEEALNDDDDDDEEEEDSSGLSHSFLDRANEKGDQRDKTYGVYRDKTTRNFFIGDSKVKMNNITDALVIKEKRYPATDGLWSLLTHKKPLGYTDKDLENYMTIIIDTNAHRARYKPGGRLMGNSSYKWTNIIRPYLNKFVYLENKTKTGEGLTQKLVSKRPVEYVYWNKIDELVERLDLLHRSRQAGNTGVDNEIISIEEELREEDIIK